MSVVVEIESVKGCRERTNGRDKSLARKNGIGMGPRTRINPLGNPWV